MTAGELIDNIVNSCVARADRLSEEDCRRLVESANRFWERRVLSDVRLRQLPIKHQIEEK